MNIQMEEMYRARYMGKRAMELQCPPRTQILPAPPLVQPGSSLKLMLLGFYGGFFN